MVAGAVHAGTADGRDVADDTEHKFFLEFSFLDFSAKPAAPFAAAPFGWSRYLPR
jgi:hypothetical protein